MLILKFVWVDGEEEIMSISPNCPIAMVLDAGPDHPFMAAVEILSYIPIGR